MFPCLITRQFKNTGPDCCVGLLLLFHLWLWEIKPLLSDLWGLDFLHSRTLKQDQSIKQQNHMETERQDTSLLADFLNVSKCFQEFSFSRPLSIHWLADFVLPNHSSYAVHYVILHMKRNKPPKLQGLTRLRKQFPLWLLRFFYCKISVWLYAAYLF